MIQNFSENYVIIVETRQNELHPSLVSYLPTDALHLPILCNGKGKNHHHENPKHITLVLTARK